MSQHTEALDELCRWSLFPSHWAWRCLQDHQDQTRLLFWSRMLRWNVNNSVVFPTCPRLDGQQSLISLRRGWASCFKYISGAYGTVTFITAICSNPTSELRTIHRLRWAKKCLQLPFQTTSSPLFSSLRLRGGLINLFYVSFKFYLVSFVVLSGMCDKLRLKLAGTPSFIVTVSSRRQAEGEQAAHLKMWFLLNIISGASGFQIKLRGLPSGWD